MVRAPGRRCYVFVLGVAPLDGIFIPLMGGPLLSAAGMAVYLVAVFHQSRAHAVVAVVRVVVVQRAVRIDVADVVGVRRIRRIKMYPERFSSSRFVPLLPRGRHVLHFKRKF